MTETASAYELRYSHDVGRGGAAGGRSGLVARFVSFTRAPGGGWEQRKERSHAGALDG